MDNSPFFVLITFCSFLGCEEPKQVKFDSKEACKEFVGAMARNSSAAVTCFERSTGRVVFDSKGRR